MLTALPLGWIRPVNALARMVALLPKALIMVPLEVLRGHRRAVGGKTACGRCAHAAHSAGTQRCVHLP
jgi:hypothetical protein